MNVTQNPLDVKLSPKSIAKVVLTIVLLAALWAVTTRYVIPLISRYVPGASRALPSGDAGMEEGYHTIRTV